MATKVTQEFRTRLQTEREELNGFQTLMDRLESEAVSGILQLDETKNQEIYWAARKQGGLYCL